MPSAKKGDRVIVMRNADRYQVYIYGYGTYMGPCKVTDEDIEAAPEKLRDGLKAIKEADVEHQKIVLDDNRGVAWGFMCWWGPIKYAEAFNDGKEVVTVELGDELGGTAQGIES